MNKRTFTALLALILLLACGCSLAQPEENVTTTATDRLAGVFITTEHLDLNDMDAWLEENAGRLLDGESPLAPGVGDAQARIYAELTEKTITDSSGTAHTTLTYEFKGLDGIFLAVYIMGERDADSSYRMTDSSEYVVDLQTALKSLDNETVTELTGSIFIPNTAPGIVFYFNPIYQTADGEVYLVPGRGMQASAGLATQKLTASTTATENGQTHSSSIEVKIDCVEIAKKIVFIEMDENNTAIGRTEFIPGRMPDEFIPAEGAAYLIVEEHLEGGVSRSVYQNGDAPIAVFYSPDGRLCLQHHTTVTWPTDG